MEQSALSMEQFLVELRAALNHLYDPDFLQYSPLMACLHDSGQPVSAVTLQRWLIDAIQAQHPAAEIPEQSQQWRTYNILLYRYIQKLTQNEVAVQVGLSRRQLAREQDVALKVLAYFLREKPGAVEPAIPAAQAPGSPSHAENEGDFGWIEQTSPLHSSDVKTEFEQVLALVSPLAERHNVQIRHRFPKRIPNVNMHAVAFRQVMIALVHRAILASENGEVRVNLRVQNDEVELTFRSDRAAWKEMPEGSQKSALDDVVMRIVKGKLELSTHGSFTARLVLPVFQPVLVLLIDDNPDILALFQRFTHGTQYQVIGTRDPNQAIAFIEAHQPQVIVLDVMMPEMDGWQMLGRLRSHPTSSGIPIMVCSIVSQEELAFTLGAKSFLRKPVHRDGLLSALDALVATGVKEQR